MKKTEMPDWITRGKTISELIEELRSFEDQTLMVEISVDAVVHDSDGNIEIKK